MQGVGAGTGQPLATRAGFARQKSGMDFPPQQRYSTITRAVVIRGERAGDAAGRSGTEDNPLSAVPGEARQGLAAYAAGSLAALLIPGIPPVNGIVAAFLIYACLVRLT